MKENSKHNFLLVLVTFWLSTGSEAQLSIGIEGGSDLNFLVTSISNRSFSKKNPSAGYLVGLKAGFDINERNCIFISPMLIKKAYVIKRTGIYTGLYQSATSLYAQFPFYHQFRFAAKRKIDFYFNYGVFIAYWVSGKMKGAAPNMFNITDTVINGQINEFFGVSTYAERYRFNRKRDNRIEYGGLVGAGLGYELKNCHFSFDIKLYRSLSDLQKKEMNNQAPQYNHTYTCTFSISRRLFW